MESDQQDIVQLFQASIEPTRAFPTLMTAAPLSAPERFSTKYILKISVAPLGEHYDCLGYRNKRNLICNHYDSAELSTELILNSRNSYFMLGQLCEKWRNFFLSQSTNPWDEKSWFGQLHCNIFRARSSFRSLNGPAKTIDQCVKRDKWSFSIW